MIAAIRRAREAREPGIPARRSFRDGEHMISRKTVP